MYNTFSYLIFLEVAVQWSNQITKFVLWKSEPVIVKNFPTVVLNRIFDIFFPILGRGLGQCNLVDDFEWFRGVNSVGSRCTESIGVFLLKGLGGVDTNKFDVAFHTFKI